MKEKVREIFKSYFPGFILGIISVSIITVYAETFFPSNQTTYDNSVSGLQSTNVQDAIDELYGVCSKPASAGDTILDNTDIVTSGDGLYKDEYEDRYFYKGANPNNYVTFNDEQAGWRIISVENDGTIKIIKNNSVIKLYWDDSWSTTWSTPSSINTYLNETYYNGLTEKAKGQMTSHNFNVGAITRDNNDLLVQINDEKKLSYSSKVGLITASEYIRANSNISQCGTYKLHTSSCKSSNWIYNNTIFWTISPSVKISGTVITINTDGALYETNVTDVYFEVRPVIYLRPNIVLSGDGSQNNPYTIE